VSRNGATLVAARARGFPQPEANALSREVGLPVTLGAVLVGGRVEARPTVIAFLATLAALPLLRVADRAPLWPWALYRCGLALALMRGSAR
jgi:undecaprenyl pyrophosphate phosphatase UppP